MSDTITVTPETDFFRCPSHTQGYGSRVFIKASSLESQDGRIHALMKLVCCWGGADKCWDDRTSGEHFYGFELPSNLSNDGALDAICTILKNRTLTQGELLA